VRSVIDANLAVYAVLPGAFHNLAWRFLERLVQEETALYASPFRG